LETVTNAGEGGRGKLRGEVRFGVKLGTLGKGNLCFRERWSKRNETQGKSNSETGRKGRAKGTGKGKNGILPGGLPMLMVGDRPKTACTAERTEGIRRLVGWRINKTVRCCTLEEKGGGEKKRRSYRASEQKKNKNQKKKRNPAEVNRFPGGRKGKIRGGKMVKNEGEVRKRQETEFIRKTCLRGRLLRRGAREKKNSSKKEKIQKRRIQAIEEPTLANRFSDGAKGNEEMFMQKR